jgi:hypothetical protein
MLLNPRVDISKRPDGARDGGDGNFLARRVKATAGTGEFGIGEGELQPECSRLGVDAVAAADRQRQLVLNRAPFQRREQPVDVGHQQVGGTDQLQVEARVENIRGSQTLVDITGFGADQLR